MSGKSANSDSNPTGFHLDIEEDYLIRRVSHERNNFETTTSNSILIPSNTNSKINIINLQTPTANSNPSLNEGMLSTSSEGFGETKQRNFVDDDEKEEILLETLGASTETSGISVEAYPRLTTQDYQNVALLVVLYLLQGIPVGLAFGSIPFLLKSKLSYSQIGFFSLASYPYSLKLLWSPIVDATYSKKVGRRKSWIIPIQLLTGSLFFWLGNNVDVIFDDEKPDVFTLTLLFFILIFFSATQDIAVDGWALTLLSKNSLSYASTAQTIGLNTGYFLSFTVFLALNSADFSNKYFRTEPSDVGFISLGSYLSFWSVLYFVVTVWLIFVKGEDATHASDEMDIKTVYQTIWNICKMPHMRKLILVLLVAKIGFIANEAVTGLKLLEKGFGKEDLALAVLIDFPFQILVGYYAAKWSNGPQPLKPWIRAFYGRLFFAIVGMLVVYIFPGNTQISSGMFIVVIASTVLSSFMSTVQFVSISAFMTTIADPVIGGTYMTLLATFSNFGGTWPRFFVLEAVDYFTDATCNIIKESNTTSTIQCVSEQDKMICKDNGGTCVIHQDGYYIVSIATVAIGTLLLFGFIIPQIKVLQALPPKMWKLKR
ncbi:2506_t:CDS:10 [Funneliformis caledonium]|uniref:2506_t:CDS:1 n=1 Tax=Funneliformis caledonium TaxID=1117310 RepID=A0A9N8YUS9_9GLOM|nr:2506_t:CDS:10 [Funneliformis caledonium]